MVKFVFSHSKLRKLPFFADIFKIQGGPLLSFRRPWSEVQTTQMGFLRRVHSVTLLDKVCSCEICKALNVEPLVQNERSSYVRFGHMSGISHERLARQVLLARPTGKRPRGRPKTRWSDYFSDLLGPVLVCILQIYLKLLLTVRYFES